MEFTVILLTPDTLAETFGQDTGIIEVSATTPDQAIIEAQRIAVAAYDDADGVAADDFHVIAVFAGSHVNLA